MSSTNSFCRRPWRRPCGWRYNTRRQWRIGRDLPKKRLSAIDMLRTALFAGIEEIPYLPPGCQKAGGTFKLPLGPHSLAPLTHRFYSLSVSPLCPTETNGPFFQTCVAVFGGPPFHLGEQVVGLGPAKPQVPTSGLSAASGTVAVLQDKSDWKWS